MFNREFKVSPALSDSNSNTDSKSSRTVVKYLAIKQAKEQLDEKIDGVVRKLDMDEIRSRSLKRKISLLATLITLTISILLLTTKVPAWASVVCYGSSTLLWSFHLFGAKRYVKKYGSAATGQAEVEAEIRETIEKEIKSTDGIVSELNNQFRDIYIPRNHPIDLSKDLGDRMVDLQKEEICSQLASLFLPETHRFFNPSRHSNPLVNTTLEYLDEKQPEYRINIR